MDGIIGGGKMNNNMNFNWEKKISLKEIAQFYEDKLRELDSKQNSIISNLVKENEELTNTIKRLEANIQPISNIFIRGSMEEYCCGKLICKNENNIIARDRFIYIL